MYSMLDTEGSGLPEKLSLCSVAYQQYYEMALFSAEVREKVEYSIGTYSHLHHFLSN